MNVSSPPTGYRSAASRTWPDHAGRAAPDAIYWMPPDPAIGEVRSAWSNQTTTGFRRLPAKQRAMLRLGFAIWAGVLTGVVGVALTGVLALLDVRLAIWIPYALASVPVALPLAVLARPRPQCTYLGDEGVAVHAQFGLGTRHHVLRFADARSLLREEVEEYPRGRYKGTRFVLRWRDAEDRVLLELAGLRYDHGLWAEREHAGWELAAAAEARWNELRRDRALAAVRARGEALFRARDVVFAVGPERLRVLARGEEAVLTPADVRSIVIEEDTLVLRRRGAREGIVASKDVDRFLVRQVEDVAVLLHLLRTVGRFPTPL